jgi:hypothetical protein
MNRHGSSLLVLAFCIAPGFCGDWNPKLAADYLDSRQKEWFAWKPAAGQGGPCLSCHTGLTYLLARPALRRALGESEPTSYERGLLDAVGARLEKFTAEKGDAKVPAPAIDPDSHTAQSRGVESVLTALFFARERNGASGMSGEAQRAFDRMWSLQIQDGKSKGAWAWFNLNLDPWEMPESRFYGAALAALAVGSTPAEYRNRQDVRDRVAALTAYLRSEQDSQPLHNRLMLLWASTKLSDVASPLTRQAILEEVWRKQQKDGGWSIQALGPFKEHSAAPLSTGGSGYATGLITFVLEQSGASRSDSRLIQALDWLKSHQDRESGYWAADSMNKRYEADSMQVRFMRDAATGFATLALIEASPSATK